MMKCPKCVKKISILKASNDFVCPHCKTRLSVKNTVFATVFSLFVWYLISLPSLYYLDYLGQKLQLVIDWIIGPIVAFVILKSILRLEEK